MTEIQKVTDCDLMHFLSQDLAGLDINQKYSLFKRLEIPITYAIGKVFKKFHFLPLEKSDFLSIAWIAFEDVLNKYQKKATRKSFTSFVIDSVYWKSMDYACSFINNKHKVLNNSSLELNWIENPWRSEDLGSQLTTKIVLEEYFHSENIHSLAKAIFHDFVYQTPLVEICQKYQISRNKLKNILTRTIADLSKLLA